MPICKKIKAFHRKGCIGDMRWRIDLFTATIKSPPIDTGVDYSIVKTPFATVWASVKTLENVSIFDSMNTEQTISHEFVIRFLPGLTQEKYLRYPAGIGQYYNIVYVEDFENRHEFMLLKCNIKGNEANV